MLRRGGVVCPEFEDRFLDEGSQPHHPAPHGVPVGGHRAARRPSRPGSSRDAWASWLSTSRTCSVTGHRVFLAGSTTGMRDRLGEILQEYELPISYGTEPGCRCLHLPLSAGVHLKEARLLLLTEREVFGRKALPAPPKKSRSVRLPVAICGTSSPATAWCTWTTASASSWASAPSRWAARNTKSSSCATPTTGA